jgi:pimeloyl-ACP methyl ester carboxylesterase
LKGEVHHPNPNLFVALLAEHYRGLAFEVPGFGQSPVNERSQSVPDLARTMTQAVTNLGLERFNLMQDSWSTGRAD